MFEIREFCRIESPIDSKPEIQSSNSIRFVEIRELRIVRKFVRSGNMAASAITHRAEELPK
jgi:hypothetical protein